MQSLSFGIDLHAAARSGWFRRKVSVDELAERLRRLAPRVLGDQLVRSGRAQVDARLHAGAPLTTLVVTPEGTLHCTGETASLGPGYHCELVARLSTLVDELDLTWTESPRLDAVQAAMCAWLAGELASGAPVRFGVARRFRIDAPLLSPLGPRDAAWCDAVRSDPMRARDVFPWWDVGPGRQARARALLALWHDVPWREPLDSDENALLKRVDDDLRTARSADATLDLPWHAWKELLAIQGVEDEDVEARVAAAGAPPSPIGYRRHALDVELSGGWSVTLPAAMVGHWEDDGARYWATDGDRMVDFSSMTAGGEHDSERLLAVAPEKHEVVERHADGSYRGRAEAFVDGDVPVVVGLMARAPHVGILTCKGGDRAWALATWRSLRLES